HVSQELYSAHVDHCYSIMHATGVETHAFFTNAFPALKRLNKNEQTVICKDYLKAFSMFDCYQRTKSVWKEIGGRFTMCSMVTCYDAETGLDGDRSRIVNLKSLTSSFENYGMDQNMIFLPLFNRIELTEQEVNALMVLELTEAAVSYELSDEALRVLGEYREEAPNELQEYYREELGIDDFSRRLGNLVTISHTIQECKTLFN
ncbi:hypothetical protein PMAYCL1PPCAC_19174, partial [Pristionchus mayeri]